MSRILSIVFNFESGSDGCRKQRLLRLSECCEWLRLRCSGRQVFICANGESRAQSDCARMEMGLRLKRSICFQERSVRWRLEVVRSRFSGVLSVRTVANEPVFKVSVSQRVAARFWSSERMQMENIRAAAAQFQMMQMPIENTGDQQNGKHCARDQHWQQHCFSGYSFLLLAFKGQTFYYYMYFNLVTGQNL